MPRRAEFLKGLSVDLTTLRPRRRHPAAMEAAVTHAYVQAAWRAPVLAAAVGQHAVFSSVEDAAQQGEAAGHAARAAQTACSTSGRGADTLLDAEPSAAQVTLGGLLVAQQCLLVPQYAGSLAGARRALCASPAARSAKCLSIDNVTWRMVGYMLHSAAAVPAVQPLVTVAVPHHACTGAFGEDAQLAIQCAWRHAATTAATQNLGDIGESLAQCTVAQVRSSVGVSLQRHHARACLRGFAAWRNAASCVRESRL